MISLVNLCVFIFFSSSITSCQSIPSITEGPVSDNERFEREIQALRRTIPGEPGNQLKEDEKLENIMKDV